MHPQVASISRQGEHQQKSFRPLRDQDGPAGRDDQFVDPGRRRQAVEQVAADGAGGDVDHGEDHALAVDAAAPGERAQRLRGSGVQGREGFGEFGGPGGREVAAAVQEQDGGLRGVRAAPAGRVQGGRLGVARVQGRDEAALEAADAPGPQGCEQQVARTEAGAA
ncbi:hypothetical protein ACQEU6_27115 [Spirillospora sp. CA-108201]